MKKKLLIRPLLCCFVLLTDLCFFGGCSPLAEVPVVDDYWAAKNAYEEEILSKKDYPTATIDNIPAQCLDYQQQISRYYLPLLENWPAEDCFDYGLSKALPLQSQPESIGFTCVDINNDGINELLIGLIDQKEPIVLELWAMVNEKPKLIAQADEESRYYLRYNSQSGQYIWENCTGPLGDEFACFYFTFNGEYMEFLWNMFPGIDSHEQDEIKASIAAEGGVRIAPDFIAYGELQGK